MDATPPPPSVLRAAPPRGATDEPDLDELIGRFRGALVGLLRAWGAPDPIELAQDVFAEAWLARGRFDGAWSRDRDVGPWLRGIAWNLCAAAGRRRAGAGAPLDAAPEPVAPTAEPGDAAAAVRAAIDRLPGELRAAIRMHYLERTPVKAVAALLGVPPKTVEGRLYRARKELARLLAADAEREGTR